MGERNSQVEDMVIDRRFWAGRRVLLTGHTGFKGAWTALVLRSLGAEVHGFARSPDDEKSLFVTAQVERDLLHCLGDIRDLSAVHRTVAAACPDLIIHMAAQALVRLSYAEPVETYATNVMGTINVLEAARHSPSVKAIVVVTSDKCYENNEWVWGYRESDRLGGHDPYSNSKACTELVIDAYRRSFFRGDEAARVGSARAGNVIGGGDWARDRLVPDAMRSFLAGESLPLRNPDSLRPWQHVLDPILGYLMLAERLSVGGSIFEGGWNFGPTAANEVSVERIVDCLVSLWGGAARWHRDGREHPHEATYLKLDCSKALSRLGWRPVIGLEESLRLTVEWYRAFLSGTEMRSVTLSQVNEVLGRNSPTAMA
jgi:CDP-glucose 4,6-dehydratase